MRSLIGLITSFFFSVSAFAWGNAGHEAVGIIAEKNLTRTVKAKIKNILNSGEDLAKASMWPDQVKYTDGWGHTRPYHYVNINGRDDYYSSLEGLTKSEQEVGDIVRALVKAEDVLRDPTAKKSSKANALRFIVHFVGDLHQPLHAGYSDDKGGNAVETTWQGTKTNLHSVWDAHLINTFMGQSLKMTENTQQASGSEYVLKLRTPSAKEIAEWQSSYVMTWLNESLSKRDGTYKKLNGSNDAYYSKNIDPLNDRVLQAGYRLGAWLNAIFTDRPFAETEAAKLRADLAEILKKQTDESVVLEPQAAGSPFKATFVDYENGCEHTH